MKTTMTRKISLLLYVLLGCHASTSRRQDERLTICVAIPCVGRHLSFLPELFKDIANQTILPVQIALSISDMTPGDDASLRNSYREIFNGKGAPGLLLSFDSSAKDASANRNTATATCSADIVR